MGRTFLGFGIIDDMGLGFGVLIPNGVLFPEPAIPPPAAVFVTKIVPLTEGASASVNPTTQLPVAFPLARTFQPPPGHAYAEMGEALRLQRLTLLAADGVCCNPARQTGVGFDLN